MDLSQFSYEEAVEELERVLELLENDDCSLEEAVNNFKRGIEIHKFCTNILTKTEGEVKILLGKEENNYEETSYLGEAD